MFLSTQNYKDNIPVGRYYSKIYLNSLVKWADMIKH